MTVQSALSSRAHDMEYFLCIEGIGWPTDEFDLTSGFNGDVFTTNDLNGDLATVLGCTVRYGLNRPSGISDSLNTRTMDYSPGSARFVIQEQDDYLLTKMRPHTVYNTSGTLYSNLDHESTTVVTSEQWSAGAVVWLASAEAIKLGTEAGPGAGGEYTYSNCTRAYLGTQRGRQDNRPTLLSGFAWESGTVVTDYTRVWRERRCILYMHVPGETVGQCVRLYTGVINSYGSMRNGNSWNISTSQDITTKVRRIRYAPIGNNAIHTEFVQDSGAAFQQWPDNSLYTAASAFMPNAGIRLNPSTINYTLTPTVLRSLRIEQPSTTQYDSLACAMAYNYRNMCPGGTKGMRNAATSTPTAPQAYIKNGARRMDCFLKIQGNYVKALYQKKQGGATNVPRFNEVTTTVTSYQAGSNFVDQTSKVREVKFMLDNYSDIKEESRFWHNGAVTRNPIDVLLMFLTSTNNEYRIADTNNTTAGSTTQVRLTAGSLGSGNEDWSGYALFAVEDSNLGESRKILYNNYWAGAPSYERVYVDAPFSNAPTVSSEYQIRNTVYDRLPLGWGLGIHHTKIDIDSFEDVRTKHLDSAELGKFIIGEENILDLWGLLIKEICVPYGILLYVDRQSGKLSAKYISSSVAQDGLDQDYIAITHEDILEFNGDIDYAPRLPISKINLKVREKRKLEVNYTTMDFKVGNAGYYSEWVEKTFEKYYSDPSVEGGESKEIPFIIGEKEIAFNEINEETLNVSAMFDTEDSIMDGISSRMSGLLLREAMPAPVTKIKLDMSFVLTVQVGSILNVTDTTNWAPVNPMTGEIGWTNVICRVIATRIDMGARKPGIHCDVEILYALTSGMIASACDVDGTAHNGVNDCFVVHYGDDTADYSENKDLLDWRSFRKDDLIEHRDITGALTGTYTILGFGGGAGSVVDTPDEATEGRIYVTVGPGGIGATAAGDYLTFQPWSASNTSNMSQHAAYADSSATLGVADAARKYL